MDSHIETNKQGITLDKSLAWTMAVALIGGGIFVGSELRHSKTQLEAITAQLTDMKLTTAQSRAEMGRVTAEIDGRLRVVETMRAGDSAEIATLRRDISDLKTDIRGVRTDLQEIFQYIRNGESKAQ